MASALALAGTCCPVSTRGHAPYRDGPRPTEATMAAAAPRCAPTGVGLWARSGRPAVSWCKEGWLVVAP